MVTDLAFLGLRHTFLIEEGVWKSTGELFEEENLAVPVCGWMRVHHHVDHWLVAGNLSREGIHPLELLNQYRVQPGRISVGSVLHWSGEGISLGEVRGHFLLLEDAILSQFYSVDGRYRGNETWFQLNGGCYLVRGMLMVGDRKTSAWALELKRAGEVEC